MVAFCFSVELRKTDWQTPVGVQLKSDRSLCNVRSEFVQPPAGHFQPFRNNFYPLPNESLSNALAFFQSRHSLVKEFNGSGVRRILIKI